MIFAAGFGTRMGDLTKDRPKPLIHVAGKALIDHALDLAQGMDRIVVNTHYQAEMITEHLSDRNITISHEAEILETGGGLRNALAFFEEDAVLTLNSDAVWQGPNPLTLLQNQWRPEDMDALVLTVPKENAIGHPGKGDFLIDEAGRITRGPGDIYVGAGILATHRLAEISDAVFSLNAVWDRIMAEGRLFGCSYPGKWCDVGTPEGITLAEDLIKGSSHV